MCRRAHKLKEQIEFDFPFNTFLRVQGRIMNLMGPGYSARGTPASAKHFTKSVASFAIYR